MSIEERMVVICEGCDEKLLVPEWIASIPAAVRYAESERWTEKGSCRHVELRSHYCPACVEAGKHEQAATAAEKENNG